MNRKAWIAFIVVQLLGELSPWAGLHLKSSLGPALWVVGMAVMMPGRLLGLFVTEKALWNVRLTPPQTTVVFVVVEVAANLLVWLLCACLLRSHRRRHVRKAVSPTASP
jgi:hypothetical protein